MDHVQQVAGLIKQYETRAEKLRAIQALLAHDPALIEDLRRILFPPAPEPPTTPKIDVLTSYLRSQGNEWQTAGQITVGTNLPRNTVNFLLFASKHKGLFESEMRAPKKKVWRLKDDGIIRLKKRPKPVQEQSKMGTA